MTNVVDFTEHRAARNDHTNTPDACAIPAAFQDALGIIAAASANGDLDLATKVQMANALAEALGPDAAHPGYWQFTYRC
jgi:hypothetical protein